MLKNVIFSAALIRNEEIKNNLRVKLLSVKSNSKLTFNTDLNHIGNILGYVEPYLVFW